jgi:putative intracellular protease/amidase
LTIDKRKCTQTPATNRLKQDKAAQALLADTARLSTVAADDYDAVFYPGGHGPLWDWPRIASPSG